MSTARCVRFSRSGQSFASRVRRVIWTVDVSAVGDQLRQLPRDARPYWDACVAELESNPRPRQGYYLEQVRGVRPRVRTYLYEITEMISISGDKIYIMVAEFFPFYIPVYRLDEAARRVVIIFLRENHLV